TTVDTGDVFATEDEDALYEFLGYQPIPPELREDDGELDAARRGELPQLVELSDVRGDLHTHTSWSSDGKNTLEEMVEAAAARGYEYYAITDHSHYLREGRLEAQLEEIERVRALFPKLRVLAGVEANDNPYVDCIGHLTGRRIGKRGPREVDVERVIEKALAAGVVLEINGQP